MNVLILFARAPIRGRVKTRLLSNTQLNEEEVCQLYSAFLRDTLKTVSKTKADKIILCFEPAGSEEKMRKMAQEFIPQERLVMDAQSGESFHEKIKASFQCANESGATSIVMIGSDSPTLQSRTIDKAFELLTASTGSVLGPSGEGGMYLIGLNSGYEPDFKKIFGDSAELSNFARELKSDGVSLSLLEEVTDVDVASDLVSLVSLLEAMVIENLRELPANTIECIGKLGLSVARNGGTRDKVIIRG